MFENVDITYTYIHTYIHTYIQTTGAYLCFKLTNEPKGSGELIKQAIMLKAVPRSLFTVIYLLCSCQNKKRYVTMYFLLYLKMFALFFMLLHLFLLYFIS